MSRTVYWEHPDGRQGVGFEYVSYRTIPPTIVSPIPDGAVEMVYYAVLHDTEGKPE